MDVIHEQYRHPSQHYHDKEVAMRASWLGGRARSAAQPRGSRIALAAHSQPLRLAAAALAGAAAVAIATRR